MKYKIKNGAIHICIPASNEGRFRFKTRKDSSKFGKSFAARSKVFNDDVYLEWQIGYDATTQEIKNGEKKTELTETNFVGYNKKVKYPYELSELLYVAVQNELIDIGSLKKLEGELESYKEFLSDKEIDVQYQGDFTLNGLTFKETTIKLPTFFYDRTTDGTQIEVSIQKQQYAAGVQPMIYFAIPLRSFENSKDFYDRISKQGDELVYILDKQNADVLLSLFKVFGTASPAHSYDIKEILKVLLLSSRKRKAL